MISVKTDYSGYVFNPLNWIAVRVIASAVVAIAVAILIRMIVGLFSYATGVALNLPVVTWLLITVLLFLVAVSKDQTPPVKVPETKFIAMLTWLGIPLPLFLETGNYDWLGTRFGIGLTKKTTPDFTDTSGFIKAGQIPFKIWNTPDSSEADRHIIVAPAKNRADIRATLTLILESRDPRKTLDSDDPELDIGDRARQEFRELVGHFVDTDVPSLHQAIHPVLTGVELLTCFIPKAIDGYKAGAMIRDHGDEAMFVLAEKGMSPSAKENLVKEFTRRILTDAQPRMKEAVVKSEGETESITYNWVRVQNPITEVTTELGFKLVRTTLGDIILSEQVVAAANQASAEADERLSQLASAETARDARAKLLPSEEELKNPAWETAMILAAAQDDKTNSIKVVLVPGAGSTARGLVAAAGEIGAKHD